jgi:hypothetical protein
VFVPMHGQLNRCGYKTVDSLRLAWLRVQCRCFLPVAPESIHASLSADFCLKTGPDARKGFFLGGRPGQGALRVTAIAVKTPTISTEAAATALADECEYPHGGQNCG